MFQWLSPPIHAETPHLSNPICTWYYTPKNIYPWLTYFNIASYCEYANICSSQIIYLFALLPNKLPSDQTSTLSFITVINGIMAIVSHSHVNFPFNLICMQPRCWCPPDSWHRMPRLITLPCNNSVFCTPRLTYIMAHDDTPFIVCI